MKYHSKYVQTTESRTKRPQVAVEADSNMSLWRDPLNPSLGSSVNPDSILSRYLTHVAPVVSVKGILKYFYYLREEFEHPN